MWKPRLVSENTVIVLLSVSILLVVAGLEGTEGFGNGKLDDVRIYNRALTSSEVMQLYRLGQTRIVQ